MAQLQSTVVTGNTSTTGYTSTGARKLSLGILDLNSAATPTQFKIKTSIPFALGNADFTVNIKGFRYGATQMVSLSIGWHYYLNQFFNETAICNGGWAPTVTLGRSPDGFVVIHLDSPGYWPKLYVESVYSSNYTDQYSSGWTWSDADMSDCTEQATAYYNALSTSITGNSATTSQTNFTTLTLNSATVATQTWVQSQGYLTAEADNLSTVTSRGASTSSNLSLLGSNKIVVQNSVDGGSSYGIFMWNQSDYNWGIYMGQSGTGRSFSGGSATVSMDGRTEHHVRFRVNNSASQGFIWENSAESVLMSLQGDAGNLYVKGEIYAGTSTTNKVWHSGNDGTTSGLDADLLDGQHGTYYRNASNINAGVLGITRGGTGLNSAGNPGYLIRVDAGQTAFEYFDPAAEFLSATLDQTIGGIKTFSSAINASAGLDLLSGQSITWRATLPSGIANARIIYNSGSGIALYSNGTVTPTMFLDNDREVGIGTVTPAYKLDVNGTLGVSGAATFSSSVTGSSFVKSGGTASQFLKADGSVDTNTYATTSSLGSYLPLAGGIMTGDITWTQTERGLVWGMNTDGAYIKFFNAGDGDTNSRLEYATSDNGDEYHRFVIASIEKFSIKDDGARVSGNLVWHAGNLNNLNQLTNGPGYITAETDTLQSVTGRGASSNVSLTLSNTNPLIFTGFGSGTYTSANLYVDTNGLYLEAPLAVNSAGAAQKELTLTWRGGYASKGGLKLTGASTAELGGYSIWHSGNDSSFIKSRAAITDAALDTTTSNGTYQVNYGGSSSSMLVFNEGGSLGPFQLEAFYTGGLRFRNKTDSSSWTVWKTIASQGWVQSQGYLTSYTETDNLASVTGRGASTSTNVTLSGTANQFSGHHYFLPYDGDGNHYPHYNVGANNNGSKLNLRMYAGSGSSVRLFYLNGNDGSISWDGNTIWHAGNLTPGNYLPLAGGTITGLVTFSSAVASRPQMPGGILGLNTGDGNFDIWGISTEYYPSHATSANAWGILWNGDSNQIRFIGAGTQRLVIDLDGGSTGALTWEGNNIWHAGNLTNLNQLSNGPGYITGYTETDTLQTVTNRGSSSSNSITLGSYLQLGNGYANGNYGVRLEGVDNGSTGHDLYIKYRATSTGGFSNAAVFYNTGLVAFNNGVSVNKQLTLQANPTGTTYGNGVSTVPPNRIEQAAGDDDGWRLYGESTGTNSVSMVFEVIDDLETAGNEWIFRNKKTYGAYDATTPFRISGSGVAYVNGNAVWHGGNLTNVSQLSNDAGYLTSANLSGYLSTSGGTVSGNLNVTGGIHQNNIVGRPYAAWGATSATGPVIISFPGGSGNYGMIHAVIDIYEYNSNNVCTIVVGGHNWNSYWVNYGANVIGTTNKSVRLGFKDSKYCIVIGDSTSTWDYGQVVLRKIQNGTYYQNSMDVYTGYTVAIGTDSYTWISGDLRKLSVPGNIESSGQVSSNTINTGTISSSKITALYNTGVTGASVPSYTNAQLELQTTSSHVPAIGFHRTGVSATTLYEYDGQLYVSAWTTRAQTGLLLSSGNYNSYAPSLTGTGASGTWSIKIRGTDNTYANGLLQSGAGRADDSTGDTWIFSDSLGSDSNKWGIKHNQTSNYIEIWGNNVRRAYFDQADGNLYLVSGTQAVYNSGTWGISITGNAATASSVSWANIASKPTTLSGFGITDAAPKAYITNSYVDFYIYGDQDTYYPVTIHNWNGTYSWSRYTIHRGYSDTAPWNPIGTGVHQGGLTFSFEWAGDIAWGGNDKSIRIIEFNETYTTMVGGMQLANCEGVVIWLRGGGTNGAFYRLHGPGGQSQTYTINMSTWTSCSGVSYSSRSYDSSTVNSEINSRYPIRGNGSGDLYSNNNIVLNAANYTSYALPLSGGTLTGDVVFTNLKSSADQTYGILGRNGYFDTINGRGSDALELNYYDGGPVKIGSGTNGSKSLYAVGIYDNGNVVLHAGNYNSYAPSLTGAGAYGSWGINITGSAASASTATTASSATIASTVTINDSSSGAWYDLVWRSGNTLYRSTGTGGEGGVQIYAAGNYIRCQYLNTTDNDEAGITRFVIKNGDSYHRSATTTVAADIIRGVASGSWGISVTGSSASCTGNAATATRANGNFYIDNNYGNTIVGVYTSTRYQGVFAMGDSYKLPADGTSTGSLYGLAWSHPNAGGVAANLNTHGLLVMENGTFLAAVSGSIRARDDMRAPSFYASSWFYSTGNTGWTNSTHGGGWYMEDSTWIRSYGSKNVYVNTFVRAQGSFRVGSEYSIWAPYGTYSAYISRLAYISFDWDANYDSYSSHGIASTDLNGNFTDDISINSYSDINFRIDSNSNDSAEYVRFHHNSAGSNQFAYIGYTGSAYVAEFSGTLRATGDVIAYYSDARLKKDVRVLDSALDKLAKINGYYYKPNEKAIELLAESGDKQRIGVLAQEIAEVFPEVVEYAPFDRDMEGNSKSGEDYLTVKYERLVPVLIQAIKEQQKKIEELESKLK